MAFIRLVFAHEQNIFQFQAVKKKYEDKYIEIEKATRATFSCVEEIATRVSVLQGDSLPKRASSEIPHEIEMQLDKLKQLQNTITDLSIDLRNVQGNVDAYVDPVLHKITEQFPGFFEQLEKINAFAQEHFSTTSNDKPGKIVKEEVQEMLKNVEDLSHKVEQNRIKITKLAEQYQEMCEKQQKHSESLQSKRSVVKEKEYYKHSPSLRNFIDLSFYSPNDSPVNNVRSLDDSNPLEFPFDPFVETMGSSSSLDASSTASFSFGTYSTLTSAYFSSGIFSGENNEDMEGMDTIRPLPQSQHNLRLRTRNLRKSRSDTLITYSTDNSPHKDELGDCDSDSDGYASDAERADVPKSSLVMEQDKKRNPLSKIKSKSYDTGIGNFLSGRGYKYLTGNSDFNEFFGIETTQEIILIHIDAIHTRAEIFSQSSPKELDYDVFKNQLEYTRVHGEKIVKKIDQEHPSYLQVIIKEGLTLRDELKILIIDLGTIENLARLAISSDVNQLRWAGRTHQLTENCDSLVLIANQMQNYIEQGEEIWSYIQTIHGIAQSSPGNLDVLREQLKKACVYAEKILMILQEGHLIYFEDVIVDKIALMNKLKTLIKELRSIARINQTNLFTSENESSQHYGQLLIIANQVQIIIEEIEKKLALWITEINSGTKEKFPQEVTFMIAEYLGLD